MYVLSSKIIPYHAKLKGTSLGLTIAGAWRRPLFVGGWTHSDDTSEDGETTFNLQTASVFIDMRIPKAGDALLGRHRGFHTMKVRDAVERGDILQPLITLYQRFFCTV